MLEQCLHDADHMHPMLPIDELGLVISIAIEEWKTYPGITSDMVKLICDAAECGNIPCSEHSECPVCPECPECPECGTCPKCNPKVIVVAPWMNMTDVTEVIKSLMPYFTTPIWSTIQSYPLFIMCAVATVIVGSILMCSFVVALFTMSKQRMIYTSVTGAGYCAALWAVWWVESGYAWEFAEAHVFAMASCAVFVTAILIASRYVCARDRTSATPCASDHTSATPISDLEFVQTLGWKISTKLWNALTSAPTAAQRGRVVDAYLGPLSGGIAADVREWVSSNWASLKAESDCSALHSYLDEQGIVEHMMDE